MRKRRTKMSTPSGKFCFVIITPDAIRENIQEKIIKDILQEAGCRVIWRKNVHIEERHVREIYPQHVDRKHFPSIVRNFISGPSLLFLLKSDSNCNLPEKIKEIKGLFDNNDGTLRASGLRAKHGAKIVKNESGEIFEFRFHSSENELETKALCNLFLKDGERISC